MIRELQDLQASASATFASIVNINVPITFGNDAAAIQATQEGVAVCDRSHWGRIRFLDQDRVRFLHNQTTNNLQSLKPGQGCDTVVTTSTARTLDLVTAYITENDILILTSPNRREQLLAWFDRYIFPADQVQLEDATNILTTFSLIGPQSHTLVEKLGADALQDAPHATHQLVNLAGIEVRLAVGSGLATAGYTLITEVSQAAPLWQALVEAGAVPLGDRVWEQLRIEQGRPAPDHELTEDYNPLEAGLWQTISFNKGCYIGQETIARLDTYKGVKQRLWGVRLSAIAEPGSIITLGEEKVGTLTSVTEGDRGPIGLAYIRTKAGGEGLQVQIEDHPAEIIAVPFLTHDRS